MNPAKSGNELEVTYLAQRWDLRRIRGAIRSHRLSFPSQVPIFKHLHRPDVQWRMVVLFFVHGWACSKIARRYGMTRERVKQLVRQWTSRAIRGGYIDRIPSEQECSI
jgi:hypothetical protein